MVSVRPEIAPMLHRKPGKSIHKRCVNAELCSFLTSPPIPQPQTAIYSLVFYNLRTLRQPHPSEHGDGGASNTRQHPGAP
jgi:hypothetical protein